MVMNSTTYSIALQLVEVMDCDTELRGSTSSYGDWYDNLVEQMCDYEAENFDQVMVLKTLKNQLAQQ